MPRLTSLMGRASFPVISDKVPEKDSKNFSAKLLSHLQKIEGLALEIIHPHFITSILGVNDTNLLNSKRFSFLIKTGHPELSDLSQKVNRTDHKVFQWKIYHKHLHEYLNLWDKLKDKFQNYYFRINQI